MESNLYSPEEIIGAVRIVANFAILYFITAVGTYTKKLIQPSDITKGQYLGLSILSTVVAFALTTKFGSISKPLMSLICFSCGYILPSIKNLLTGKSLFRIASNVANNTKSIATTIIEEVGKEIEEDERKSKENKTKFRRRKEDGSNQREETPKKTEDEKEDSQDD